MVSYKIYIAINSGRNALVASGVSRGHGRHLPRAQHFVGAKVRSECYVIIMTC